MKSRCYFDCKFPIGNLGLRRGLLLPKLTRQVWRAETTIVSLNVDVDQLKKSQEQFKNEICFHCSPHFILFFILGKCELSGKEKDNLPISRQTSFYTQLKGNIRVIKEDYRPFVREAVMKKL